MSSSPGQDTDLQAVVEPKGHHSAHHWLWVIVCVCVSVFVTRCKSTKVTHTHGEGARRLRK